MPFLLAFVLALAVTPLGARLASVTGFVDHPSETALKIHPRPVPLAGGLAVVIAAIVAGAIVDARIARLAASGIGVAFLTGTLDDRKSLPAIVRVVLLVFAGSLIAAAVTTGPDGSLLANLAIVLLVVATANAVNVMDGQDGLVAGLATVALVAFTVLFRASREATEPTLILAGAVAGFLVWNRPPARVFLGNGGAYALGAALAFFAATLTKDEGWIGLLTAGTVLVLFAVEVAFTLLRRVASRERVAVGDRLHSYDLAARHIGREPSTLAFYLAAVGAAVLGVVAGSAPLLVAVAVTAGSYAATAIGTYLLWVKRDERSRMSK